MLIDEILHLFPDSRPVAGGYESRCPAHDDNRASLSLSPADNGGVVLHCHAGCSVESVTSAVGLTLADLMPAKEQRSQLVATYDYVAEDGELLYQVCRFVPKDFRQRRPDGTGWKWSIKGVRRVLYMLPELLAADTSRVVFVCEGEKDVDALAKLGAVATTNSGGAGKGKWLNDYSDQLAGRHVVILPDNDQPGREHSELVARLLSGKAAAVKVLALPGLPDKGDVSDWLAAGGTLADLERLASEATEWKPVAEVVHVNDGDDDEDLSPAGPTDPGPMPARLLQVPGFIERVKAFNLETATRPQEALAFAGAACLQATLAGRKVRDPRGNRTCLYFVGIGPSGSGKEHARQVNTSILYQAGLSHLEGAEPASDAGLISAVERNPSILFQIDELGKYLKSVINVNAASHLSAIVAVLLRMYSAGNTAFFGKSYRDADENKVIHNPNVVLHGTTVPQSFYEGLTAESLSDGFIARLLVFEASRTLPPRQYNEFGDPPKEIVEEARYWGEFNPGSGNLRSQFPQPLVIHATPAARVIFDDLAAVVDSELTSGRPESQAIWARTEEKACRLALVYACSANREAPVVDDAAARWACDLSAFQTRRLIWLCSQWVSHSAFDSQQKKVVRAIRERGGRIGKREIIRILQHLPARQRDELLQNLIETRQITEVVSPGSRGRPKTDYVTTPNSVTTAI